MMRRSLQGGGHVWWGAGAWWLWGRPIWLLLIWRAFLVHTYQTHPAFWVVGKWTVYCIVLWAYDYTLDRGACDCKMSNTDMGKLFTVKCGTITVKLFDDECCQDQWQQHVIHYEILCRYIHLNSWHGIHQDFLALLWVLLMHVHCCCWNGLARFSQYYIKILHVLTRIQYIYILHKPALIEYNGLEGSFVQIQHAACQVFNGNVGHFRILQKCHQKCIVLAIYWLLFSQANSNI